MTVALCGHGFSDEVCGGGGLVGRSVARVSGRRGVLAWRVGVLWTAGWDTYEAEEWDDVSMWTCRG